MPTLLPNDEVPRHALRGYRISLFSHDHPHPPHVHFSKSGRFSSWDLRTGQCTDPGRFSSSELREQATILSEFLDAIWRSWNAHWQRQDQTPPRRRHPRPRRP